MIMIQNIALKLVFFLMCSCTSMLCLAQSGSLVVHEVKKGETLYSLSKEYAISVDEILTANPDLKQNKKAKLKKGYLLNIPKTSGKPTTTTPSTPIDTFKLAIVLPFTKNSAISERAIEFYRGILMAANEAKKANYCVEVSAFDEVSQNESLRPILDEISNSSYNFVIGPLYPSHFNDVCDYALINKQKTIIPFSSKVTNIQNNPYLYLLNTPNTVYYEKVAKLFDKTFQSARTIFVRTANADKLEFTDHLMQHFLNNKYEVQTLPNTFVNEDLERVLTEEKQNIFIFDGSDWDSNFKLVQSLVNFKIANPRYNIKLVGHNEWQVHAMDNADILHEVDTYIIATDYYDAYNKAVIDFEENYKNMFNTYPLIYHPRIGELGYDSGLFMLNAMALYGNNFTNQDFSANYLQTKLKFEKISHNGGYVNTNILFIHYTPDQQIECIELK